MLKGANIITADGPVVIFDDDLFFMGSVLAELLADAGEECAHYSTRQEYLVEVVEPAWLGDWATTKYL